MDTYLHYKKNDFVEDDSFIRFVQKRPRSGDHDWATWIADHPEKEGIVSEARTMIETLSFKEDDHDERKADLWKQIAASTGGHSSTLDHPRKKTSILRRLAPLAAAACLGFVLYFTMGQSDSLVLETVAYGDTKTILLPDGSTVDINAGSTLSYDAETYSSSRAINLSGEAFFDVRKGVPFVVTTDGGTVKVLGTSFNVFSREKQLHVDVRSGLVMVESQDSQYKLKAGDHVSLVQGQSQDLNRKWSEDTYTYTKIKLSTVIADIERTFDLKVDIPEEHLHTLYSGSFTTDDAHNALVQVLWPLNLEFNLDQKQVVVKKKAQ